MKFQRPALGVSLEAIGNAQKIRYCQYGNDKMIFKCVVVPINELQVPPISQLTEFKRILE